MHISVRLQQSEPIDIQTLMRCPFKHPKTKRHCTGTHFKPRQAYCRKPVRDLRHAQVTAQPYRSLKCQHCFRVYPIGVSNDHQSDTLKALSVLLYILDLSYQGVADLLESLRHPVCKATVYNNQPIIPHPGGTHPGTLEQTT